MITTDLKFGSPKHEKVLKALLARKRMSERDMKDQEVIWQKSEKDFQAYMPKSANDKKRITQRDNSGVPQYVTLEIPYAYAMILVAHTYLTSVFYARTPVLQYAGRHGESEMNVQAVESLMDYQTTVGGHLPPYYVWMMDVLKYGVGIIGTYWEKEEYAVSKLERKPRGLGGTFLKNVFDLVKTTTKVSGYEGNRLFNIRPHDYLPDTRVPLNQPHRGEFIGWKTELTWNMILKRKAQGQYMNIDKVKEIARTYSSKVADFSAPVDGTRLPTLAGDETEINSQDSLLIGKVPGMEMIVELVPKEWELGTTDFPEKWMFTVVDDKVVIEARPLGLAHNKYPVEVIEGEVDGYSLFKRSMFDIGRPLNDTLTWLFNTHFYSVRKSLNGQIVYDPSRVSQADMLSTDPGWRIKLRPQAYGQDVRTMIHVITQGGDVTQTHLKDAVVVEQLLQRVMGIPDNLLGAVTPGGRKTATEIRTVSSSAINRMRTMAEYISATGFSQLSAQMLQTSQERYSGTKKFRIAGDAIELSHLESFMEIDPDIIAGEYDYVPVDGTLPVDRFAIVNMWGQLLAQMQKFPEVAMQYDIPKIFAWVAQQGGLKNIKQFKIQVVGGPGGAGFGTGNAGNPGQNPGGSVRGLNDDSPVIPIPAQTPGMGPSG